MYYLLYSSSAPKKFDDESLHELLEISRANNAKAGVSGMLLYADGNFIQYIEGEETAVRALYSRIIQDPRHRNHIVLSDGETDTRMFPDWTMGFRGLSREEVERSGAFRLSRASLAERIDSGADRLIVTMMRQFYNSAFG